MKKFVLISLVFLVSLTANAQIGIFDDQTDVGQPDIPGVGEFDSDSNTYTVDAVGFGIGDGILSDQFHFVFSELSGSFAIQADPFDVGGVGRGGLMVRQSLDDDAPHASLMMTGDFNVWPHIRSLKGGGTIFDGDPDDDLSVSVRIERMGNSLRLFRIEGNGNVELLNDEIVTLEDTVFAGLTASGDGQFGFFEFTNVSIEELPFNVQRTFPDTEFSPGTSLNQVTLTAQVREGQTVDGQVHEVVPRGASVANIQASAGEVTEDGAGTLIWTLDGFSGEAMLSYDITLPNRSAVRWQGTFNDGIHAESFIGGISVFPTNPDFTGPPDTPYEIDLFFPTIIEVENGENLADPEAFGFGIDPSTTNGINIINVDANASDLIEYHIMIPEDGTYYLFGNVRGEDGNSDSWHFDVDIPPDGTDFSRWNIPSSKEFVLDWVEQESPNNDPRPFDLTAGEHFLYLAGREDSASIDWLAVTNDSNLDLATFDPSSEFLASRSLSDDFLTADDTMLSAELRVVLKSTVTDSVVLQEPIPSGFTLSNLSANAGNPAQNADGGITWDVTGLTNQELILSFNLTPPVSDTPAFQTAFFTGELSIAGQNQTIGGDDAVVIEGNPVPETGQTAFHFIETDGISLQDQVVASHLRNQFRLTVEQFDDDGGAPDNLSGAAFGIVSGSVGSGNIAGLNIHVNDPRPFITYETFLFDEFAFAPAGDPPTQKDVTTLQIVNNTHPITQGLELGLIQVHRQPDGIAWLPNPPEGVTVLATLPGNPNAAVLWVIDANTTVNGNNVPGVRLGWGLDDVNLSPAGIDLFNRVLAFALGVEVPEPPAAVDSYMLY